MQRKNVRAIVITSFALLVVLSAAYLGVGYQAMAQEAAIPFPNMAPIKQYLMPDQGAEIAWREERRQSPFHAMQRSWFLDVMVSKRRSKARTVSCIVERSWTSTADADFWNPKVRTPICYNAAAARTNLLRNRKRTELILAGRRKAQVDEVIAAAVDKKERRRWNPVRCATGCRSKGTAATASHSGLPNSARHHAAVTTFCGGNVRDDATLLVLRIC